jgi:predicted amino acid-binding ACT domain protein
MVSPGLRHPDLAAVAARAATAGSPSVLFDITHDGPETGLPAVELVPPTARDRTATETLAFHVADVGFQVHTWTPVTPSKQQEGVTTSRIAVRRQETDGHARGLFAGSVVINPDFLYDTEHSVEILVTLDHEPWRPSYADSLMITLAYQGMTDAASSHDDARGVPVLFLQSPVAPFRDPSPHFRVDGSGEAPRVANGMALRMLVGLEQDNHGNRIALMCRLAELATANGFGLQVADRRFGRVRGEWWSVLPPNRKKYVARRDELFGWAPNMLPSAVQLLTFVGPARMGSSAAIASDLMSRNVGILAVSESSMQEIAFINMVVPLAPARIGRARLSSATMAIADGLGQTASECGLTRRQAVRGKSRITNSAATDYRLLRTGPMRPPIKETLATVDYPLWLSWGIPMSEPLRRVDVAELVVAQLREAADRVASARIDYYRARVLPDGHVTGRAKIAVSLVDGVPEADVPQLLSDLCPWAQRESVARLLGEDLPLSAVRLRLAWRERWLGHTGVVA